MMEPAKYASSEPILQSPAEPEIGLNTPTDKEPMKAFLRRLRKQPTAAISGILLIIFIFTALLADFLAYGKPYYAVYQNETYFPIFNDYLEELGLYTWPSALKNLNWRAAETQSAVWPPIPYSPNEIDANSMGALSPAEASENARLGFGHPMGTDELGRDVLSGCIHGARVSLKIGLLGAGLAALLGVLLGGMAGYFGDNRIRINILPFWLGLVGFALGLFYAFRVRSFVLGDAMENGGWAFLFEFLISIAVMAVFTLVAVWLGNKLSPRMGRKRQISIPVDLIISKTIELMISVPALVFILTICALAKPNVLLVILLIGFMGWIGIARYTRAEFLKLRGQEFMLAAQAQGLSAFRIIFRHALPNALAPIMVAFTFSVSGAILFESALGFLGIGIPPETVTWGSLLNGARNAPDAWWLLLFPGLCLFLTIVSLALLGDALRKRLANNKL